MAKPNFRPLDRWIRHDGRLKGHVRRRRIKTVAVFSSLYVVNRDLTKFYIICHGLCHCVQQIHPPVYKNIAQ